MARTEPGKNNLNVLHTVMKALRRIGHRHLLDIEDQLHLYCAY